MTKPLTDADPGFATPAFTPPPAEPGGGGKPLLLSKTIAVNVMIALASLWPPVGQWVEANSGDAVVLLCAANVILRLVTKSRITLWRD